MMFSMRSSLSSSPLFEVLPRLLSRALMIAATPAGVGVGAGAAVEVAIPVVLVLAAALEAPAPFVALAESVVTVAPGASLANLGETLLLED